MAIQNTTSSLFKNISDFVTTNVKQLCILFSFFLVIIGLFFAHKLWVINRERSAQYDFSVLMTEYETMMHEKDPEWAMLLDKFEKNYEKHSHSSLLPYYLEYKVKILLQQGEKEQALVTLNKAITEMVGSPIVALYEMERALIQLDGENSEEQTKGLQALQTLATDTNNMFRDSAQYYLGSYYWAHDDIDQAREVWQKLVNEQRDEKMSPSPWVQQVQGQLALTTT